MCVCVLVNSTNKQFYEHEITWRDLNVGDIVKIEDNEFIPADVIMLASSTQDGAAYMETSSLDGEKAPKQCLAINEYQQFITIHDQIIVPANASQRIMNNGNEDMEFYCVCTPRFMPHHYINLETKNDLVNSLI